MKKYERRKVKKTKDLLDWYDKNYEKNEGEILHFDLRAQSKAIKKHFKSTTDLTAYNITKPIIRDGQKFLLARVEPLQNTESKILCFQEKDNVWTCVEDAPALGLEDPFYVENIHGYHIVGGVYVGKKNGEFQYFQTYFYRYKNRLSELIDKKGKVQKPFAMGPRNMKDIRLIELENGKIGVFTRPQGSHAGLGKIAYIEIESLDDLESAILKAKIIENQFNYNEWGGPNELHLLQDGKIGVLGHIAHITGDRRNYYAMAFVFDPKTCQSSEIKILTTADDFPMVEPKLPSLGKVVFSGGLQRHQDGTADLYVGIGDREAGRIRISDPFASVAQV